MLSEPRRPRPRRHTPCNTSRVTRRLPLTLAALGLAWTLAPAPARACEPLPPGLTSSVPADGEGLPANAAVLFFGQELTLTGVSVTVDGAPAALVPADAVAGAALAARVDPPPAPGQTVVIAGDFCQESGGCGPSMLTFTASAADDTSPTPVTEGSFFAIYDHGDFVSSGGDCQYDSDLTFYVHLVDGASVADARTVFTATWDPDGLGPIPAAFGRSALGTGGASVLTISVTADKLLGKAPTDVCLTIQVADLAGNPPASYELCPACYLRQDATVPDGSTPPEPAWTEDDAVPGSACAGPGGSSSGDSDTGPITTGSPTEGGTSVGPGSSSSAGSTGPETGGETGGEKGCACAAESSPPSWLLLLGVLGLGRRRSRR